MTLRVRGILQSRWEGAEKPQEGWVWPAPTGSSHLEPSSIKKQHFKALAASKVRPFVLYSLRHTFLTFRLGPLHPRDRHAKALGLPSSKANSLHPAAGLGSLLS